MNPQDVLAFLQSIVQLAWSYDGVKVIVSHILINVVVALGAAQKTGDVNFQKLGEFLTKKLLPYVSVYVVVKVFGEGAGLAWLAPACWAIIEATLAGDLADNLSKLGVPMPGFLARR